MTTNTKLPKTVWFLLFCFIAMLVWWISIQTRGALNTVESYFFGFGLGVVTAMSGITGLSKSKSWGGFKSNVGRFIIFLSSGFIAWGIGSLIIAYFNLSLNEAYPYPSIADLAYILGWPMWLIGMVNLSKATGARFQAKKPHGKLFGALIIIVALVVSYYLLFTVARGSGIVVANENFLKLFFDFAYPVGDIVIITSSLLLFGLSFNYLGGAFKLPILLVIIGFIFNYIADIIFTYINTVGTYQVGNWVDMVYVTVFVMLGIAVNMFDQKRVAIN